MSDNINKAPKQGSSDTMSKKVFRVVSDIVFLIVCISLVGGSILFATSNDPRKNYFGYRTYNVLTKSMSPKEDGSSPPGGFDKGDTIIIKMCEPEEIQVGDIITFNPNSNDNNNTAFLTHRVVEVLDNLGGKEGIYFVTRGDSNNSNDPPISGTALIGKKVAVVPKVGTLLQYMREHFIQTIIMIASMFCAILMFKWYFAKPKTETEPKKTNDDVQPPT